MITFRTPTACGTSSPLPVPDYAAALPVGDDEAAGSVRGMRLGLPRQYFVPGMEPGVEARVSTKRRGRAFRRAPRDQPREGGACA